MSWLAIHIWLELLVAAGFGGLIGWALHARRQGRAAGAVKDDKAMAARIAELEASLMRERAKAKAPNGTPAPDGGEAQADAGEEEGPARETLAWRNRYLESRVRFLEGRVSDLELGAPASPPPEPPQEVKEEEPPEAQRLRWRNRYLEGRIRYLEDELVDVGALSAAQPQAGGGHAAESPAARSRGLPPGATQPPTIEKPHGVADDLKEITGIGPKLERILNGIGIWHFHQIAAWTKSEVDWINATINFRNRVERENWIEQATQLAAGVEADGKRLYHEGKRS